jgi:hypothetical protein
MKRLWDGGGYRAAILAQAILIGAFVVLVAITCRSALGSGLAASIATAFATFLTLPYLSFRPVTLAIVLLAVCYFLIERDRLQNHRTRTVWLIVPLTTLLINIHLFAIFVPLWTGAIWAGMIVEKSPAAKRCRNLFIATLLACCATPLLPGIIRTAIYYQFQDPMVSSGIIAEMQPFWRGELGKVSVAIIAAFLVLTVVRRKHFTVTDWLLLIVSTLLLFQRGRHAPLFAVVAAPLFCRGLSGLSDRPFRNRWLAGGLAALLLVGIARVGGAFPAADTPLDTWLNRHAATDPTAPGYPTAAARVVLERVHPATGRIVNEFTWGGYLGWRLAPAFKPFMDGRTQVFPAEFWRATYLGTDEERLELLRQTEADAAVLPRTKSKLKPALVALGWRTIYTDAQAEVLVPPAFPR